MRWDSIETIDPVHSRDVYDGGCGKITELAIMMSTHLHIKSRFIEAESEALRCPSYVLDIV